jgi:RNA polymerase sigma factor (sigma-70 family)
MAPPMNAGSDSATSPQLLERVKAGDESAVGDLIDRVLPHLRRWARGRLPARARGMIETQDVIQETIIRAVRHIGRLDLREEGALQAYLRGALAHRFIDLYRKAARDPIETGLSSQAEDQAPSPLEELIGTRAVQRYEAALAALSPTDRQAIVLRIELGWEYDEIATAMRKNGAAQARMMVSRALDRLAQGMGHVRE